MRAASIFPPGRPTAWCPSACAATVSYTHLPLYPCWCTRAQLHAASAPHAGDGTAVYPGTCRALTDAQRAARAAAGRAAALRIAVPDETICFTDGHLGPQCQNLARDCGDFVLRRADGV